MNYKDLIDNVKNGREIEFSYNNINFSITNYDGRWYFCNEKDGVVKSQELSEFSDYIKLEKNINKISIYGKTIRELFDNNDYEEGSLYIL